MATYGTEGDDTLLQGGEVYGLGGNDFLFGSRFTDHLHGGAGRDQVFGGAGDDWIYFTGSDEPDDIDGGDGVDRLWATDSTLTGIVYDFAQTRTFYGGSSYLLSGIEYFFGGIGDEHVIVPVSSRMLRVATGGGDDVVETADPSTIVILGDGDDLIYVLFQPTNWIDLDGGAGNDTLDFSLRPFGQTVYLSDPRGMENLTGTPYDDWIAGTFEGNILRGGGGSDEIYGLQGDDVISGGAGPDALDGGEHGTYGDTLDYSDSDAAVTVNLGAKLVSGGHAEGDTIDGFERAIGSAFDDLFIGSPMRGVDGGPGSDTLDLSGVGDVGDFHWDLARGFTGFSSFDDPVLQDLASIENFLGSAGPDVVRGTSDDNFLSGNSGNDRLFGMAGDDRLGGGAGDDLLDGGEGNDTADYSIYSPIPGRGLTIDLTLSSPQATGHGNDTLVDIENLIGSGWADDLAGNASDNRLEGRGGNDALSGGGGADTLLGGDGDDLVKGQKGGDDLLGDAGDDRLYGGAGNDQLFGGSGADILQGHSGDDTLTGGAGDDLYFVDSLGDTVVEEEGAGIDEVRVHKLDYVLPDNVEVLRISSGHYSGTGNALANEINGSNGNNAILGLGGNDILRGRGGSDTIDGGAGNDVIAGNAGRDFLTGGSGADRFVFTSITDSAPGPVNADVITDFSQAQGDRVQLAAIDAIPGGADDKFAFIGTAAFSGTAGELRYRHEAGTGDTLVEMDVDGDGVRDMTIRLTGTHDLVAGDFIL